MIYRILDNIQDISGQELADIISTLPQWRQEVVMRYKFESGRRESALAFRLLQKILIEEKILDEKSVNSLEFTIGEHGKPAIKDHEDIHFNLSHCKHAVACAVSRHPIGIDVEEIGRYSDGVAKYSLSEYELNLLYNDEKGNKRPDEDMQVQFTILWTKKEALLKLLGTGITDDIKSILLSYNDKVTYETIVNTDKKYVCTIAQYL